LRFQVSGEMHDQEYAFATGRIRGMENQLLDAARFRRLIEVSLEEAVKLIAEAGYKKESQDTDVSDVNSVINLHVRRTYEQVKGFVPDPALVDLFTLKYEVALLKSDLRRRWISKKETALFIPEWLKHRIAELLARESLGPQAADIALDKIMYEEAALLARSSGSDMLIRLFDAFAIASNLLTLFRGRMRQMAPEQVLSALVPSTVDAPVYRAALKAGWEEIPGFFSATFAYRPLVLNMESVVRDRSFESLERDLDNAILVIAREGKRVTMGPEAVAGFLVGKEFEAKNLRIIFAGKADGQRPETIRGRLRDSYA